MGLIRKVGYLVVVLVVAGGALGILGAQDGPAPEVESVNKPTGELVSQDETRVDGGREFSATLQNSGESGELFVSLWIGPETPEQLPDTVDELRSDGFERVRTGSYYYDADERRAVTFTESGGEDVGSYAFYGFAKTYRATVTNTGATGPVNVSLHWENSDTGESELVTSSAVTIPGGESEAVELKVQEHPEFHHPGEGYDSWNVRVEPA